jgi:thiol-disulfide isomerase/thioredoxin
MVSQQKVITPNSLWVQFNAGRPGVVPAGTDDSTQDLHVYENAMAIVETAGKSNQVQIGTLIQVGDTWRLIDVPQPFVEGQADATPSGFFFQAGASHHEESTASSGSSDVYQKLLGDLESLDREIAKAAAGPVEEQVKLTAQRAELIDKLSDTAKNAEDRTMWLRQLTDMVSAAVQNGICPDGANRLSALLEKLKKNDADKDLAAYVKFRQLSAAYALSLQAPKSDFATIQAEWLKNLEQYITDSPTAPDAAEAMLQLAIAKEFAGQDEEAKKWYGRIVKEFPDTPAGKKATGAQKRLDSVGQVITLSGKSPSGGLIDLAKTRGKVVLVQYWATWSEPAKVDMAKLKELFSKYGSSFTIIGVNLDNSVGDLNAYLKENPLPWAQIYEEGNLDSQPANALGILTVPTMILIDQQGKVVSRNITVADLEPELKKLIRK